LFICKSDPGCSLRCLYWCFESFFLVFFIYHRNKIVWFLHTIMNCPNTNYNLTKNFGFFYYSLNITFTEVSYWPCPSFFLSSTTAYLQQTASKFDQELIAGVFDLVYIMLLQIFCN
jgi:hypothetical protein